MAERRLWTWDLQVSNPTTHATQSIWRLRPIGSSPITSLLPNRWLCAMKYIKFNPTYITTSPPSPNSFLLWLVRGFLFFTLSGSLLRPSLFLSSNKGTCSTVGKRVIDLGANWKRCWRTRYNWWGKLVVMGRSGEGRLLLGRNLQDENTWPFM